MKKLLKLFTLFVVIALVASISSCYKEEFREDCFLIEIKGEYKEAYVEKQITVKNFDFGNVKSLLYSQWNELDETGYIYVFLENEGKEEIEKAIEESKKLDFISDARKVHVETTY